MIKTTLTFTMDESFMLHGAIIDKVKDYKKLALDGISNDRYFHRDISETTKYFVDKYNTSRRLLKKLSDSEWTTL